MYVATENSRVVGYSEAELSYCNEPVSNWEDVADKFNDGMEGIYVRDGIATFEPTEADIERIAEREAESDKREIMDALPDAVADLSEMVSDNAVDVSDLMDAIAELSEIVSNLMEGE